MSLLRWSQARRRAAPAGLDQTALEEAVRQSVGAAVEGLAVEMSRIRLLAEQGFDIHTRRPTIQRSTGGASRSGSL